MMSSPCIVAPHADHDRITAMMNQEDTFYGCTDYLCEENFPCDQARENRLKAGKFQLPSPQHMRLALEEFIQFTDSLALGPAEEVNEITSNTFSSLSTMGFEKFAASTESPTSTLSSSVVTSGFTPDQLRRKKRGDSGSLPTASTFECEEKTTRQQLACWRSQMCSWSYTVVDKFNFDRETVAIAFSFLDRYLAMDEEPETITREEFQLLSMTALYTSIKMNENNQTLSIHAIVDMSRGFLSADDVSQMEMDLLSTLKWRVNPPTAVAFVLEFMPFLPISADEREDILSRSSHLTELAVGDSSFIACPASSIAVASILIAAKCELGAGRNAVLPRFWGNKFEKSIRRYANINTKSDEFARIYNRLEHVYQCQP